jgi:hypothetical protein
MTLSTLEDVRALVHRHLPAQYRSKQTWQRVASITTAAARGQLPADDVAVALKLVLSMDYSLPTRPREGRGGDDGAGGRSQVRGCARRQ